MARLAALAAILLALLGGESHAAGTKLLRFPNVHGERVLQGRDPRLERGVAELMKQLPPAPVGLPPHAAPPIKTLAQ